MLNYGNRGGARCLKRVINEWEATTSFVLRKLCNITKVFNPYKIDRFPENSFCLK